MANYRITDFQPKIAKEDLITLVNKCQERTFSEDIDYIEQKGGDQAFSELLGVDFNRGLDSGEITSRAGLYGTNQFEEIPMKGFLELMWTALEDFTLRILLVAAAVSVIANMIVEKDHREIAWIEGFTIFMAVMICSSVTALNDYQKEKQFRKLNEVAISKKTVNVWRDAKLISVHESALVTGDIVKITEGMQLNADMMLLQAFDITIDEAALTGEANAIRKMAFRDCVESRDTLIAEGRSAFSNAHTYSPILMSGTTVLTGEGKAVVLVVGDQSCIGRIRSLVQQEPGQTPLQEKLEVIAEDIGKFGLVSAIITFFILLLRFFIDRFQTDTLGDFDQYLQIISYIIIAITVVVVAIPEGLPLAVTLSLAYSMHQMLKDNNLVRRMEATETMGGADNICTDKTGTLTQNKMTLTAFWNMRLNPIDGYKTGKLEEIFNPNCHNLIRQALACNSSATLSPVHGSKTEICLLEFLQRYGEDYERIRTRYLDNKTIRFPFSSLRKRMTTIIEVNDEGSGVRRRVHIKGAAEIILSCCRSMYDFDEMRVVPLTDKMQKTIETEIENMSDQALRTLCIAYKDIKESEDVTTKNSHDVFRVEEDNFIFLGILGVKDILRREVKVAIAECKAAGIKVRMVTGDNKTTAKAIARECGIIDPYDPNSLIMTGPEFMERVGGIVCKACQTKDCDCPKDKAQAERTGKEMRVDVIANSAEFDKIYSRLDVLARSRPEDKYALVAGLIERGAVVAVTGDGTNDAPALKKADVGFAMNSGTEVAKEAADIILIDDNFASIVESVKWGRNIYENIRKFLQFQLTVNVVAVGITLVGAGILKEAVFTAVQLLWMNLIMDTLASLALATETPHDQILGKRPYDRNEYILSSSMKKHIIGQAIYQFLIIIVLIFTGDKWIPESLPHDELEDTDGHQLKYYSDSMHVRSGRSYFITTGGYDYEKLESVLGPSRHFTIVFNTFVFLQVFNFLNCRKLNDERNIFKGITKNKFFLFIVTLITILQVTIIKYGGLPMSVSFHGLDGFQWLICIGLASGSLVWSAILKRIHVDPHWAAIRQTIRSVSLPKKSKRDDSKAEKTRSFGRLPSIDLDTHDAYLGTDASPKKDQELGLLHIKAH